MSEEERLQSLIAEVRILETYYNEIDGRESLAARAMVEARAALDALRSLDTQRSSDILVPIGGGLFIQSTSPPINKLIVSVGADIAIEKTKDDAIRFTEERLSELERAVSTLEAQKSELARRIEAARAAVLQIAEKQRQQVAG